MSRIGGLLCVRCGQARRSVVAPQPTAGTSPSMSAPGRYRTCDSRPRRQVSSDRWPAETPVIGRPVIHLACRVYPDVSRWVEPTSDIRHREVAEVVGHRDGSVNTRGARNQCIRYSWWPMSGPGHGLVSGVGAASGGRRPMTVVRDGVGGGPWTWAPSRSCSKPTHPGELPRDGAHIAEGGVLVNKGHRPPGRGCRACGWAFGTSCAQATGCTGPASLLSVSLLPARLVPAAASTGSARIR